MAKTGTTDQLESPTAQTSVGPPRFSRLTLLMLVFAGAILCVGASWWFLGMELRTGQLAVSAAVSAVALLCIGQAVRYRLRMSLRTALILMAILAAVFAFVGREINDAREESAALTELIASGNRVEYETASKINFGDPPKGFFRAPDGTAYPLWTQDLLGQTYFNPPREIYLQNATDEDLQLLGSVRQAKWLTLHSELITADGLAAIPVVPKLELIALAWDQVTPESAARLRQFETVKTISVGTSVSMNRGTPVAQTMQPGREVRESHIAYFTDFPQVEMFVISVDHFDAADGAVLASMPKLDTLNMQTPGRTRHGLLALAFAGAQKIVNRTANATDDRWLAEVIDYCYEPVELSGFEELAKSKSIRRMGLMMQEFSDEDLLTLMQMPNLEWIAIGQSQVTADGVLAARALRPEMRIVVEPLPWGLDE